MKVFIALMLAICTASAFGQEEKKIDLLFQPEEPLIEIYDKDLLPPSFHASRRDSIRARMDDNSVAIIYSGAVRNRSNDVDFEFHQDPNFYYLTGLNEPNAVLLIFKEPKKVNGEDVKEILYLQNRNPEMEVWNGKRYGVDGAEQILKLEKAEVNTRYRNLDLKWGKFNKVYTALPYKDIRDNPMDKGDLYSLILETESNLKELDNVDKRELTRWYSELREIKHEEELRLLKKAIDITCEAQTEMMKAINQNMTEYQAEALVEYIFKKNGSEYPGFPSILGSGENSCILHYTSSRRPMMKNDLLVCDIGAEYHGYTADVTRTLPADQKYSEEQKAIYNIVLEAQQAGIDACKPGNSFWQPNIEATTILSQRMKELGIIKNPGELRRYFMHGTSHYLGLDVHDVGTYGPLQANQVITVEPGIYIPEGSPCDKKWWNIGVRIEDDILITTDNPVNLSGCVPRKIEEIEALMEQNSRFEE